MVDQFLFSQSMKFLIWNILAIEKIFPGSNLLIKNGVVNYLKLQIPWMTLTSSPIIITIDSLDLHAVLIDVIDFSKIHLLGQIYLFYIFFFILYIFFILNIFIYLGSEF